MRLKKYPGFSYYPQKNGKVRGSWLEDGERYWDTFESMKELLRAAKRHKAKTGEKECKESEIVLFLIQEAGWWYGDSGVLSHSEAVRLQSESDWWNVMPMLITDSAYVALGITGLATLFLFVGCWPRVSALVILVGLTVLHHRNPLILDGEDNLFRLFAFFLALIPSGTAWSLRRSRRSEILPPMLAPMPGLVLWR